MQTLTTPKYTDIKFETEELFQTWLTQTTAIEIELVDHGQDLIHLWLSAEGEIIHWGFGQPSVWIGRFIDLEYITPGHPIHMSGLMRNPEEMTVMNRLIVERVQYLKG